MSPVIWRMCSNVPEKFNYSHHLLPFSNLLLKIYLAFYIFSFAAMVTPTFDVSLTFKVACPPVDKYSCLYPPTFCLLL